MYKCNIDFLNPNKRVELINIIKSYKIEYRLENNTLILLGISEEIEDFLEFNEIFLEKI